MGNCEKTIELLNQYADGELNESDAAFVRAHLEECEECQKAYCQLLEIEKLFKSTAEEAPAELYDSVIAKIKAEKPALSRRRKISRAVGGIAVAAAISLTVLSSPAILMVVTGGAKAECNDMAVELAPAERNDGIVCDDAVPECEFTTQASKSEDGKSEKEEIFEDVSAELTPSPGKKYTANMLDKTSTPIAFESEGSMLIASLCGKRYECEIEDGMLYLTSTSERLTFKIVNGDALCFNQIGDTND